MQLSKILLSELQRRLKVGNRKGVHLNAIPGRSAYKFDISRLAKIQENMPRDFVNALLSNNSFKFKITWKNNVPDLAALFEEDQASLVQISRALENLINQSDAVESEKGINTFGFGYPLLVRRDLADGKITVAPIMIWSLRMRHSREFNTWEVLRNEEDPIYMNDVLINHLNGDTGMAIEPFPSEMLDDGFISKTELAEILSNFIGGINPQADSTFYQNCLERIESVSSIGDKAKYESLLNKSSNAVIEFGGLFSLFEVQKQSIIDDFDVLQALDLADLDTNDMENHFFQPISSVQTDPSQQSILYSLMTKRNLLIQGPPGTGKSQTLTAVLTNALENNKKVLVVCEKRTALEVLHNAMERLDLDANCVLIKDIAKDRKAVVDSVRERIEYSEFRKYVYNVSDTALKGILNKASEIIKRINSKHSKIGTAVFADNNWTNTVGILLRELRQNEKENNLQFDEVSFVFSQEEFTRLIDVLSKGEQLYKRFKPYTSYSFLNPLKYAEGNIFALEDAVHSSFKAYERALLDLDELFSKWKQEHLELRLNEEDSTFKTHRNLAVRIHEVVSKYETSVTFFNVESTNSLVYRLSAIFQQEKRQLKDAQREVQDRIQELISSLQNSKFFNLSVNLAFEQKLMVDIKTLIERLDMERQNLESKLLSEFNSLSHLKFKDQRYHTETYTSFSSRFQELKELVLKNELLKNVSCDGEFTEFLSSMKDALDKKKAFFNHQDNLLQVEYDWFSFVAKLNEQERSIVSAILEEEEWTRLFTIFYLNALLRINADDRLPFDDTEHRDLNVALSGLGHEQLKFIRQYWFSKQVNAARNFEMKNSNLSIENLYNKRSSQRHKKLSLRQIVNYDLELFTSFFPVILTTPDVCSNLFKGKNKFFDIVLFDEASQLRLEDTLPALLKGKQVIIAGDEHQMPPSNFFAKIYEGAVEDEEDIQEEEEYKLNEDEVLLSCDSLLDFGTSLNFEKRYLDFHYRSRHPYLIDFSNFAFYQSRLKPLPKKFDYTPITFVSVNGTFSEHTNEAEAEVVLSIIENNIHRLPNGQYPTVGIATFNITQRNLILEKISQRRNFEKYQQFNDKIFELEQNGFFVKNLENIQGDERDVIILSTTYGVNKDGKFLQRLGPVNHSKGYRLLNVIITRAKYKIYVCTSVPDSIILNYRDYLVTEGSNDRRAVFYAYLAYAKAVSEGDEASREKILRTLQEFTTAHRDEEGQALGVLESPFEEEVYSYLMDAFSPDRFKLQYRYGGFRIDIVYQPQNPQSPMVAIECDGAKYHSSQEAYLYDKHRQQILEDYGFVFHRIWSTNWWRNPKREAMKLIEFLREVENGTYKKKPVDASVTTAFTDTVNITVNHEHSPISADIVETLSSEASKVDLKKSKKTTTRQESLFQNEIKVGSTVKLLYVNDGKKLTVHISDSDNANKSETKGGVQVVSSGSPLAKSILGHLPGDIVKLGQLEHYVEILEVDG